MSRALLSAPAAAAYVGIPYILYSGLEARALQACIHVTAFTPASHVSRICEYKKTGISHGAEINSWNPDGPDGYKHEPQQFPVHAQIISDLFPNCAKGPDTLYSA